MKIRKLTAAAAPHSSGKRSSVAKASGSNLPTANRKLAKPVTLELKFVDPTASRVYVAGSFNNWHAADLPLQPAGGEWVGKVKLAPGRYEYLFIVDGKWLPDPRASETVPNPFGGFNSLLSVS